MIKTAKSGLFLLYFRRMTRLYKHSQGGEHPHHLALAGKFPAFLRVDGRLQARLDVS